MKIHGPLLALGRYQAEGQCDIHLSLSPLLEHYPRGEGEHPENREQTHQSADPDQALSTSDDLFLQDGTYA